MSLFEQVRGRVNTAWEETFMMSNKVIADAKIYGFHLIDKIPSPNIHEMLLNIRVAESILDVIIESQLFGEIEYEDTRRILNAREQIRKMEQVAIALKLEDEVMFEEAISALEGQAVF